MENHTSKRVYYLDVLRIVAIFAMMLLHVASVNWYVLPVSSMDWQVLNIYDSMVRFCVPVMIMISGALFLDPNKPLTPQRLFKTNLLRLVTALAFWSFIYALAYHVWRFKGINVDELGSLVKAFILGHNHLWFLYTLIGLYLIVPFLRKISESKTLMQYFLVLSFIFTFSANFILLFEVIQPEANSVISKLGIFFALGYSGYFVLGSYLARFELTVNNRRLVYSSGFLAVILTIVGTSVLSITKNLPVASLYNYLQPNTLLSSVAVFVFFKERLYDVQFSAVTCHRLDRLSKLTFGMYLFHDFINLFFREILNLTSMSFHPILSVPVITILVFSISFVVSWILNKIPYISKYIV